MRIRYGVLPFIMFILSACAEAPVSVEQQFIDDVADAMGGRQAIESTRSFAMEARGRMFNMGQDMTPESATLEFDISDYRLSADLMNGASFTDLTRTPLFDYFRGRNPIPQAFGFDGTVAWDIGADGSARRSHETVAADRRSSYYHHPLPLMHALVSGNATVSNVRDEGGMTLADIATADGVNLTMAVDSSTRLPLTIRSTDYHFYLQDAVRTTRFDDYEAAGDVVLPAVFSQDIEEFPLFTMQVTSQTPNADIDDLAAPPEAASAPAFSGAPPAVVEAEQLAEGVWYLTGQSHHSVLLEFDDHLALIEAPNEARTLGVLAKARELVPGKPVTRLVNTHHHFDHSGGLRTATANGLTIITHELNEAFYRRMAEQPGTISPDTLAESPRAIDIDVFRDRKVYEDESMALEVYHVKDSPHSSSILMAYLPRQRLLVQADLYNPGRTTPQLFAPNLLDNIRSYGLEVDRVVPIHGDVVGIDVLETAVEALRN